MGQIVTVAKDAGCSIWLNLGQHACWLLLRTGKEDLPHKLKVSLQVDSSLLYCLLPLPRSNLCAGRLQVLHFLSLHIGSSPTWMLFCKLYGYRIWSVHFTFMLSQGHHNQSIYNFLFCMFIIFMPPSTFCIAIAHLLRKWSTLRLGHANFVELVVWLKGASTTL